MTVQFRKMPDSSWAVTSPVRLEPGSTVSVSLRSGSTKTVQINEHIYSTGDINVYSVVPTAKPDRAAAPSADVGDLSEIHRLFDKARKHLKYPAIVLSVLKAKNLWADQSKPEVDYSVRINVAGDRAKQPGSLNVCSTEKTKDGTYGLEREWYGRVQLDGKYVASQSAGEMFAGISDRLKQFADAPAKVASEHGILTGCCCFCNKALTDERSTAVGYGKICADHYGMPWGSLVTDGFDRRPRR